MGYNQENYVRIRREYENKYRLARADAERRRAEALEAIPDLRLIEQELGKTGLTLMRIAMEGEDLEQGLEKARQRNAVLQEHKRLLLESHGYPADYTEVRYECPLCMDEGFVDCKMCSCMKEKLIIAGLDLTITLGRLLAAVLRLAFRALITFLKIKKKRKGGAKQ